jgi:adenine-specific DNA-methyltransferase
LNGKSEDILKGKIKELKKIFPEAITEGKVDFEQLKATLGSEMNTDNERYVLNWAGKSEAFRVLQQPTTATLAPAPKESVKFDTTENIFIEGENLEVLKVLQKSYYGKK